MSFKRSTQKVSTPSFWRPSMYWRRTQVDPANSGHPLVCLVPRITFVIFDLASLLASRHSHGPLFHLRSTELVIEAILAPGPDEDDRRWRGPTLAIQHGEPVSSGREPADGVSPGPVGDRPLRGPLLVSDPDQHPGRGGAIGEPDLAAQRLARVELGRDLGGALVGADLDPLPEGQEQVV